MVAWLLASIVGLVWWTLVALATVTLNATNSNTITITLSSVTNTTVNASSTIDNSTTKYIEALVQCTIKNGTSPSATGVFNFYLVRSADGGTTFDDNNRVLLGSIPSGSTTGTVVRATFSTAPLGALGTHWRVAFENKSGVTTDATAGNHSMVYTGIKYDVA